MTTAALLLYQGTAPSRFDAENLEILDDFSF